MAVEALRGEGSNFRKVGRSLVPKARSMLTGLWTKKARKLLWFKLGDRRV